MENNRIEWVDYAKALAIFFVVFGHIEHFSMNSYTGFFDRLQNVFCMPLFFFLSGLFYKPVLRMEDVWSYIIKKGKTILIPFVSFGLLYTYLVLKDIPLYSLFWQPDGESHNGYWFLLVLFEIYLICIVCSTLSFVFRNIKGVFLFSIIIIWLILRIAASLHIVNEPWLSFFSYHRIHYNLPFFIAGYYFYQYKDFIAAHMSRKTFSIVSTVFFVVYILQDKYGFKQWVFTYVLIVCAIVMIVYLFNEHNTKNWAKPLKSSLSYIGQHSLDIYVIHYFFVPRNLPLLNNIIEPDCIKDVNVIMEFILCASVSFIVIGASLFTSKLFRENRFFEIVLFGRK